LGIFIRLGIDKATTFGFVKKNQQEISCKNIKTCIQIGLKYLCKKELKIEKLL
jgi:hypothetical protein